METDERETALRVRIQQQQQHHYSTRPVGTTPIKTVLLCRRDGGRLLSPPMSRWVTTRTSFLRKQLLYHVSLLAYCVGAFSCNVSPRLSFPFSPFGAFCFFIFFSSLSPVSFPFLTFSLPLVYSSPPGIVSNSHLSKRNQFRVLNAWRFRIA